MAKKQTKVDVLDQMHEAALIANEQKKKMDSLKQESDRAIARLLRRLKLPKYYSGEVPYNGYTIRIQRRTIIQFMTD
jgi:GTPase Era involved in 16S rRNA processing